MNKIIMCWEKPHWMNYASMAKELKKYLNTAMSFGILEENIFIIDLDNSIKESQMVLDIAYSFTYYSSLEEIINENDLYILLEPESIIPQNDSFSYLKDYTHKDDSTYIIWSEYGNIPFDNFSNKENVAISIVDGSSSLWSHVALGIVLYDRWIKRGCNF